MTVEKKDIDWGSLGFGYMKTDYSYEAHWKDGEWDEGGLTTDHTLHVSECGGIFHYCQEVFEGLKAYTAEDGSIVCFRPDMEPDYEGCIGEWGLLCLFSVKGGYYYRKDQWCGSIGSSEG